MFSQLPLVAKAGLAYLAYRYLTNAPPFGSQPPQVTGSPVYAKVTSKSGRQCETWTWTTPMYGFVAKCGGSWISVVQPTNSPRIAVKSNATGAELDALKADWTS